MTVDKFTWVKTHNELVNIIKQKRNQQNELIQVLKKVGNGLQTWLDFLKKECERN